MPVPSNDKCPEWHDDNKVHEAQSSEHASAMTIGMATTFLLFSPAILIDAILFNKVIQNC